MEYVVFKTAGKQYKASPGETIKVEAKVGAIDDKVEFDEVLLHVADATVNIGQPTLDAKVVGTIVSQDKAKKVKIATYKAKTGQHRHAGHRQDRTTIKIEKVLGK